MKAAGPRRSVVRANPVAPAKGHRFVDSQRMGLEVFKTIPASAPLIVAETVSLETSGTLKRHE